MSDRHPMSDVNTRIDIAAIAGVIAADIASRLGHCVDAKPSEITEKGEETYATLGVEQSFGVFAMVIKDARLRLRAAPCSDGTVFVAVSLNYNHVSGGSNGSNVGTWWVRGGEIENFRAG